MDIRVDQMAINSSNFGEKRMRQSGCCFGQFIDCFNRNLAPKSIRLLAQHICDLDDELNPPTWHRNSLGSAAKMPCSKWQKKANIKRIKNDYKATKKRPPTTANPQRPKNALNRANLFIKSTNKYTPGQPVGDSI
jgi:hypothetical protein